MAQFYNNCMYMYIFRLLLDTIMLKKEHIWLEPTDHDSLHSFTVIVYICTYLGSYSIPQC